MKSKSRHLSTRMFTFLVAIGLTMTAWPFGGSLLTSPLAAQEKSTSSESQETELWYGVLDAGIKLRMQIELQKDASGKLMGKATSLDQGNAVLNFDEVKLDDQEFSFSMKSVGAKFSGKLNQDKTVATGTFKQGLGSFPFEIKKVDSIPTRKHLESWTGVMKAGAVEFDFQFRIFEDEQGKRATVLDSFTENVEGLSCDWNQDGDEVTIDIVITKATFNGTLDSKTNEIKGNWEQSGNKFPLTLKKIPLESTRELKANRPQTPKPPFDYDAVDLTIENKAANVTLAATLTSPRGAGPFPTVVLISGSGPQDRDETIYSHKPFWVIADHLTKQGFAVLRFDDRGSHKSTGDFSTATTEDFATDVDAIVDFLKTHAKVDAKKMVLCGHSEGGLIGPMVASKRDDIAGVIMMAGPGVNGRKIALNQSRLLSAAAGASESAMKINDLLLEKIFAAHDADKTIDDAFLDSFYSEVQKMFPDEELKDENETETKSAIKTAVARTETPWFKFFAKYEPAPTLEKLKCPVLAVIGERDLQVDPELNNPEIKKALESGGNSDFKILVLPELNHLFQKCQTGALSEYNKIQQTIDESALNAISEWLQKRFK